MNWMARGQFSNAVIRDYLEEPRISKGFQPLPDPFVHRGQCYIYYFKYLDITPICAGLHRLYQAAGNRDSLAAEITPSKAVAVSSARLMVGR